MCMLTSVYVTMNMKPHLDYTVTLRVHTHCWNATAVDSSNKNIALPQKSCSSICIAFWLVTWKPSNWSVPFLTVTKMHINIPIFSLISVSIFIKCEMCRNLLSKWQISTFSTMQSDHINLLQGTPDHILNSNSATLAFKKNITHSQWNKLKLSQVSESSTQAPLARFPSIEGWRREAPGIYSSTCMSIPKKLYIPLMCNLQYINLHESAVLLFVEGTCTNHALREQWRRSNEST